MRLRLIAPVVLVLAVTAGAFFLVRKDIRRDTNRDAENRAALAATEVRNSVEQGSNLVESLRRFMLGRVTASITNPQFADIGSRWLTPVGLPAAAWVQRQPESGTLRATLVTGASPMTVPGIDLSSERALTTAIAEPRTLFRATATSLARVSDGRTGIFLVQSAPRLDRGVLQAGYAVLAFDQSGYGSRQVEAAAFYNKYPHWSQMGHMVEDTRAAIDVLSKQAQVDPSRIYLFGYSMGANLALPKFERYPLQN